VEELLKNDTDVGVVNDAGDTLAARKRHQAIVEVLRANVEVTNHDGCTPLTFATENGHESIVRVLLKHSANVEVVDVYGDTL
jgi:hypothetical protein